MRFASPPVEPCGRRAHVWRGADRPRCLAVFWSSGPAPFQSCAYHWLLPVLTGIYLLLVNVVLINLLIAMMGRTYSMVQEDSLQVWHLQVRVGGAACGV